MAAHLQPSPHPHRPWRPPPDQPRHQPVRAEQLAAALTGQVREFNLALGLASVLVLDWPTGYPAEDYERVVGLRPAPLPNGRVPLYLCAECGDLGCGSVTVRIEHFGDHVEWWDFGYENGYEPFGPEEVFAGIGPFRFERTAYLATLGAFREIWPVR